MSEYNVYQANTGLWNLF